MNINRKINKDDENYPYYIIGQNLKRLRKEKNFTLTGLSVKSNYSRGFISNLESPNYLETCSIGTLWTFARTLDVDIREFFKPLE